VTGHDKQINIEVHNMKVFSVNKTIIHTFVHSITRGMTIVVMAGTSYSFFRSLSFFRSFDLSYSLSLHFFDNDQKEKRKVRERNDDIQQ
jgi:hypothetical protein